MYIYLFLPEMARIFFILSITQIVITIISGEKSECFMVSSTHLMHQTSQNMKLHIRLTCKSFVFNIVNQRFNISRSKPPWECPWTHSTYSLLSPSHSLYTWRDLTHPNQNSALGEMKLKQAQVDIVADAASVGRDFNRAVTSTSPGLVGSKRKRKKC